MLPFVFQWSSFLKARLENLWLTLFFRRMNLDTPFTDQDTLVDFSSTVGREQFEGRQDWVNSGSVMTNDEILQDLRGLLDPDQGEAEQSLCGCASSCNCSSCRCLSDDRESSTDSSLADQDFFGNSFYPFQQVGEMTQEENSFDSGVWRIISDALQDLFMDES
jgi:hypothetical protein